MNEHDSESWRPCRAGELAEVAKNLVSLRRRKLAIQTVGSLLSVFLVIGAVLWLGPAYPRRIEVSITCSECHSKMTEYREHTLKVSDMRRMDEHFDRCRGCKSHYASQTSEKRECSDPSNCSAGTCTSPNSQGNHK